MAAHARWYDPERGRFMSREPVALNSRYDFNLNAPVNFKDPTGLLPEFQGQDLNWPECNLSNIYSECGDNGCDIGPNLRSLLNSVRKVAGLINAKMTGVNPPQLAPRNIDEVNRRAGGVTQNGTAYFNPSPNGPNMGDACAALCTCVHEWVHVAQYAMGMNASVVDKELPAYLAGGVCSGVVLGLLF